MRFRVAVKTVRVSRSEYLIEAVNMAAAKFRAISGFQGDPELDRDLKVLSCFADTPVRSIQFARKSGRAKAKRASVK